MYDANQDENIVGQFNIDSKYYDPEEMITKCDDSCDYKYKTIHLNIQGLLSSHEGLSLLLDKLESNKISIDFILLCETFLHGSDLDFTRICAIPGYEFVYLSRTIKHKGGVGIYIKKTHTFKIRTDLSLFIEGEYETLFLEVESSPRNVIIGEIYRIPNTPIQASIRRYEDTISQLIANESHDLLIGSDSNFDFMKLSEHRPTSDLFDNFISNGFIPVITRPTRITHSSATLIDNLYINLQDDHLFSGIITTKLSDHLPIIACYGKLNTIKLSKSEPVSFKIRDLSDANVLKLNDQLERYDWSFLRNLDGNSAYEAFSEALQKEIDKAAPMKTINISKKRVIREPWITKGIIKSSKTLDNLYMKTLYKPKHHAAHYQFRTYRNKFNKLKKKLKQNYYHDLFVKYDKDIRKSWEVMRMIIKKTNDKTAISDTFMLNDTKLSEPRDIANAFCDYFTNVGPNLSEKIPVSKKRFDQYMTVNPPHHSMFLSPTDAMEIHSIIGKLKPKKSTGSDNISSWLIKKLHNVISEPLAMIINISLGEGIFPDKLKIAKIIPIYKSKEKNQFNNYRPISLLSSMSKIFEKIVYKRLYNFIEHSLYDKQFGFRAKRSTVQAILEFCADTIESMENRKFSLATFLDLSKAFDTIDHNILLNKLKMYGVRGIALKWFQSYLTDRSHFIQYKNNSSKMEPIICGVPQGSVLGPLLFIIYTNDLPQCLMDAKCILFADDTTIYDNSDDIDMLYTSLNNNLNTLADWFRANKLSLNVGKTTYMLFGKTPNPHHNDQHGINIGNQTINKVKTTKFLGLQIDDQLKWANQIKHIKSKLTSSLFAIRSAKHILSIKQLQTLYKTMFQPYLEYGNILWGSASQTLLTPLETMQKKAIRYISHSGYNAHTGPIFQSSNILKVKDMHAFQVNKFMYQYHKHILPNPLMNLFVPNYTIHQHNTRHRNSPHVLHRRTAMASQSIIHKGPKLWQSVPNDIKEAKSIHSFGRRLKKSIIQTY